jgi:hypothetical protein
MTAKVPHSVGASSDGNTPGIIMLLPDVYGSIGETCGITKLTGAAPDGATTLSVRAAVATGIVRRATLRLSNKKTATAYMTAANAPKVGALATQTYTSGTTITSARFAERTRLG